MGVELTAERKVFVEVIQDRSRETIEGVLRRHLSEGSILHTDCWRSYGIAARAIGLQHSTVNHSRTFKDEKTGIHTNHVEGTNFAVKRAVPIRNRTEDLVEPFLLEFVWRRKHENNLWSSLLDAIRKVSYD